MRTFITSTTHLMYSGLQAFPFENHLNFLIFNTRKQGKRTGLEFGPVSFSDFFRYFVPIRNISTIARAFGAAVSVVGTAPRLFQVPSWVVHLH